MRSTRLPALITAALLLLLLTAHTVPKASAAPTAAYDCVGEACPSVTLTWEDSGQQFRVDNNYDRKVKITVTTFAGGDSYVEVEAHKSGYLLVKTFNDAYHADFE